VVTSASSGPCSLLPRRTDSRKPVDATSSRFEDLRAETISFDSCSFLFSPLLFPLLLSADLSLLFSNLLRPQRSHALYSDPQAPMITRRVGFNSCTSLVFSLFLSPCMTPSDSLFVDISTSLSDHPLPHLPYLNFFCYPSHTHLIHLPSFPLSPHFAFVLIYSPSLFSSYTLSSTSLLLHLVCFRLLGSPSFLSLLRVFQLSSSPHPFVVFLCFYFISYHLHPLTSYLPYCLLVLFICATRLLISPLAYLSSLARSSLYPSLRLLLRSLVFRRYSLPSRTYLISSTLLLPLPL